jgi:hypothetical protein
MPVFRHSLQYCYIHIFADQISTGGNNNGLRLLFPLLQYQSRIDPLCSLNLNRGERDGPGRLAEKPRRLQV